MHFFANLLLVIVLSWTASVHAAPGESNIRQAAVRVDALLAEHQNKAGLPAHPQATDETFVRRVYLDLAGRIPTLAETQAFLGSNQPAKRAELIQTLLDGEGYVSNFYNFWADILRLKSFFVNTSNVVPAAYEAFLKESLRANKPYDRFVHELLSARGLAWESGAVGYYLRDPEMPLENMAITSRIFLGTRIECAQCHDHPFDKWRQTEFYHLAAYTIANRPVNEAFGAARDVLRAKFDAIDAEFKKKRPPPPTTERRRNNANKNDRRRWSTARSWASSKAVSASCSAPWVSSANTMRP